ncbi:MAG: AIR synthase family protein [Thermoproteota archaeon]|nr:AIR synthase family protein [Candidatus Brockarchaeota archaeon]
MKLNLGKLPPSILEEVVYRNLGAHSNRVILGPSIGEDAAIIDMGEKFLVIHTDPITGAVENIGLLAVYVSTNDIATRGALPLWLSLVILLPENATKELLESIVSQVDKTAKEIGVSVVGGHTEVTLGLSRPIVVSTALGETRKGNYITSSGVKPGDLIILTKSAAIEGTSILANELEAQLKEKVGNNIVEKAKEYIKFISIVKEALAASSTGFVNAMHDPTESGILGGVQELCYASKVGARVYESKVPISYETKKICEALSIDPLKTISSGALLIAVKKEGAKEVIKAIENVGIKAAVIGEFIEENVLEVVREAGTERIEKPVQEEIWKVLKEKSFIK